MIEAIVTSEPLIDHAIRAVRWERDAACVIGNWLDTMSARPAGGASRRMVRAYNKTLIDRLIQEPEVRVIVACSANDPDAIFGWLCYSADPSGDHAPAIAVHMAYVKRAYRRMGLLRAMWRAAGLTSAFVYTFTPRGIRDVLPHFGQGTHLAIERYLDGE